MDLNAAVNKLRQTLGDSADQPRYIETLPGRGYRFIAALNYSSQPVIELVSASSSNPASDEAPPAIGLSPVTRPRFPTFPHVWRAVLLSSVALIAMTGLWVLWKS